MREIPNIHLVAVASGPSRTRKRARMTLLDGEAVVAVAAAGVGEEVGGEVKVEEVGEVENPLEARIDLVNRGDRRGERELSRERCQLVVYMHGRYITPSRIKGRES